MATKQKFTVSYRLLHWTMVSAMTILFITGFLRMYWMNKNHIVSIIQNKTDLLANEEMTSIAKAIREPMWQWHIIFAYVIVFAFVVRIIYMFAKGIRFPNPFAPDSSLKERLQGLTYIYFYVFVFIATFTGIFIKYRILTDWRKDIEAVHKWGIYLFPVFIILHLAGVVIAEHTSQKGITSKMIGGD